MIQTNKLIIAALDLALAIVKEETKDSELRERIKARFEEVKKNYEVQNVA